MEDIEESYLSLAGLNAINYETQELTEDGKVMLVLPTEPETSKILIESIKHNCYEEVLGIICLLSFSSGIFANDP